MPEGSNYNSNRNQTFNPGSGRDPLNLPKSLQIENEMSPINPPILNRIGSIESVIRIDDNLEEE